MLPAAGYTFEYLFALREGLRASLPESTFSPEVPNEYLPSILVLSYDLSPGVKFPRQLEQANALLDHLLTVVKKSPADIILSGDSAGANLALALLSHIAHPHPSLPLSSFPSASGAKFAGAVLISPWVSFDYAGEKSVSTNAKSDDIGQEFLVKCTTSFLGKPGPWTGTSGPDNNYIEAAHAAGNWWRDVPVDSVLVTAGADEILLDGILKLAKGLREGIEGRGGRVEVLVAKGEAHESPFLDKALGEAAGESDKAIEAFVKAKL